MSSVQGSPRLRRRPGRRRLHRPWTRSRRRLDNMKSKLVAAQLSPTSTRVRSRRRSTSSRTISRPMPKRPHFSGGNWLNVSENKDQKIVASFMRDSGNNISLGTIDVHTAKTAHVQLGCRRIRHAASRVAKSNSTLKHSLNRSLAARGRCRSAPFSPMPTTSKSRMSSLDDFDGGDAANRSRRGRRNPLRHRRQWRIHSASRSTVRRWMLLLSPTPPRPNHHQ